MNKPVRKPTQQKENGLVTNEKITARQVRLLNADVTSVMSTSEAIQLARRQNLDLVLISDSGDHPVCRIVDADRYRFEKSKQDREQARRQREMIVDVKEIQLRPTTNDADLLVKARRARGFLGEGDKVKVAVRMRGRERAHRDLAYDIMNRFLAEIGEHKMDRYPSNYGDGELMAIVTPMVSKAEVIRAKVDK